MKKLIILLLLAATPTLHHDTLDGFVANEHIDWTDASADLRTGGNVKSGADDTTAGVFKAYGGGTGVTDGGCLQLHTAANHDTSINVYQVNVDEDNLVIKQGTTTKLTLSGATGNFTFVGAGHDSFTDFVANEHIDWTDTSEAFLTTGTLDAGAITASATTGNIRIDAKTASAGVATLGLWGHKLGANLAFASIPFFNNSDAVAQILSCREGADDASNLVFQTQATGGALTDRLIISSAGNFDFASGNIDTAGIGTFGVGGVRLEDGSGDHLSLVSTAVLGGSDLTLTIDPDDAHRTLTLSGSPTLDDWFDQPVKAASTGVAFGDLAVDTTTLVVDAVNHRVGIGTNAPDSIFHIKANTPGTVGSHPAGQLIIQDPDDTVFGNAVITGYESDGDGNPDQQLWYLGSSSGGNTDIIFLNRRNAKLALGTNDTSRITILGNGNVGINVTDPDAKLEVVGTLHISDAATFDGTLGAGAITGTSFITGGDIGVAGDTDLLQLAANALTVNGTVTATGNVQGDNLLVETAILHVGDVDTGIVFEDDAFHFKAGNLTILTVVEHGLGNQMLFNTAGADIDFTVEAVGQTHALFVQGSDGKVGIRDSAPGSVFDVTGDINTTEQYKVDDVQVVSNQQGHIADAPGDTAANNATTINAILTALEAHGLLNDS